MRFCVRSVVVCSPWLAPQRLWLHRGPGRARCEWVSSSRDRWEISARHQHWWTLGINPNGPKSRCQLEAFPKSWWSYFVGRPYFWQSYHPMMTVFSHLAHVGKLKKAKKRYLPSPIPSRKPTCPRETCGWNTSFLLGRPIFKGLC